MLLDYDKALAVFRKVRGIQEEYARQVLGGTNNRLSIVDLQWVIEQMYGLKIIMKEVAFEGTFLRGLVERYDDRAIVRVRRDMSDDWKKFTAVKEMCHVVNDEQEDWSVRGVDTLKGLLIEFSVDNGELAERATQSEIFAEIAAVELLYPFENRPTDAERIQAEKATITSIATYHDIPASIVSRAHADWYVKIAEKIWGELELNAP